MAAKQRPNRSKTTKDRKAGPPVVSEDERAVWGAVKASADPLKQSRAKTFRGVDNVSRGLPPTPKADPDRAEERQAAASRPVVKSIADDLVSAARASHSPLTGAKDAKALEPGQLAGLDRKRGGRLRRGKLDIEGTLDLHGMTRDAAQAAVRRFLDASQGMGRRTVLIITGKGYAHGSEGVLRSALPQWLNAPENRIRVLAYDYAQPRHGGQGAFYVYLKKRREAAS